MAGRLLFYDSNGLGSNRMLACDAILHPAILLDQMDAELHPISLLFALRLFHFVGVALGRWSGSGANASSEHKRGNETGHLAHGVSSFEAEYLFSHLR
jgi:hypothetical protein